MEKEKPHWRNSSKI